jgi:hypothetical protein
VALSLSLPAQSFQPPAVCPSVHPSV